MHNNISSRASSAMLKIILYPIWKWDSVVGVWQAFPGNIWCRSRPGRMDLVSATGARNPHLAWIWPRSRRDLRILRIIATGGGVVGVNLDRIGGRGGPRGRSEPPPALQGLPTEFERAWAWAWAWAGAWDKRHRLESAITQLIKRTR